MYLALYRKYRPKTFGDIIGQEHIIKTLTNQIKGGMVSHAYLFCGSRGTGKTTAAKIFAKAVNCEKTVNGSPCNKCKTCLNLSKESNLDILEIDAASNNGVDEIRELKEKIEYLPAIGKYKVYIIDEVHMLSQNAFNALLKTLEEPPGFVIFILATTEVHKLPATILSRCLRFDFKLVPEQKIAGLISKIYEENNKEFEPEAVTAIARAGEGSVRDALSVADICLSYSDKKLTYGDVLEILGSADRGQIFLLIENILISDSAKTFELLDKLLLSGKGVGVLNKDIINCLRDICVVKLSKNAFNLLNYPNAVYGEIEKLSKLCSYEKVLKCIEQLSFLENELRYSLNQRVLLETYILKCCKPETSEDIEALSLRIAELEHKIHNGASIKEEKRDVSIKEEKPAAKEIRTAEIKKELKPDINIKPKPENNSAVKDSDKKNISGVNEVHAMPGKIWGTVIKTLRQNKNVMLYSICSDMECEIFKKDIIITADGKNAADIILKEANLKTIKDIINQFGEYNIVVKYKEYKEQDFNDLKSLIGNKLIIE